MRRRSPVRGGRRCGKRWSWQADKQLGGILAWMAAAGAADEVPVLLVPYYCTHFSIILRSVEVFKTCCAKRRSGGLQDALRSHRGTWHERVTWGVKNQAAVEVGRPETGRAGTRRAGTRRAESGRGTHKIGAGRNQCRSRLTQLLVGEGRCGARVSGAGCFLCRVR
ncbi:Pseudogene [Ectocarpus siliculosus]|nr:Pseudogene [Ectocarpus siliculosus]|eukprot:CBJ27117.1 Pseudogene [Ectocarpus siliculosus]